MSEAAAHLYFCKVAHRRLAPRAFSFDYRVFSLLIDINRLKEAETSSPFFSINKLNFLSFHYKDHGSRNGSSPKLWIDQILKEKAIDLDSGPIRLLCFPRVLGYTFNPISLWFCYHADQSLRAVLCEVHNTFGEAHSYLLHDGGRAMDFPVRREHDKHFHVSPFISMEARYRFRISAPEEKLRVCIHEFQNNKLMFVASQSGERKELNSANLLFAFFTVPFMTLKITVMIHWQALKIWIRGIKYHSKPPSPKEEVS